MVEEFEGVEDVVYVVGVGVALPLVCGLVILKNVLVSEKLKDWNVDGWGVRTGTPSGYTVIPSNPYDVLENCESCSWYFASLLRPWKERMSGTGSSLV